MTRKIKLHTPLSDQDIEKLKTGDKALLTGIIYAGRDTAHKRLYNLIKRGCALPFEPSGQVIYYVGPILSKTGEVRSAGPTTSSRMDCYTPCLIKLGLKGMIGKGNRSQKVIKAMKEHKAVYFTATGGTGALLAKCIKKAEIIAFEDLGPEAIYKFEVENFPIRVAIDCQGNNLYEEGVKQYRKYCKNCLKIKSRGSTFLGFFIQIF